MARTASKREEVCRSAASSDDWGLGAKTSAFIQDLQSSSVDLGGLPPGASKPGSEKADVEWRSRFWHLPPT